MSQAVPFDDPHKVIIKPLAYYKMLVHALRWGSPAMDKQYFKECMGMLIGELGPGDDDVKDVIVHDAVPINHGGKIEVAFAPEDYISFSYVDADFAEQNLFTVGWYHTHPGLTTFLSSVDVRNHLGFQTPNPSAIALVLDPMYLEEEGNMGFEVYRLNDVEQGLMAEYHKVDFEVEPPASAAFYAKIKDLVEAVQAKNPVIMEINETPDVFGDIQVPGQNAMRSKIPEMDVMALTEALTAGVQQLAELFLEPLVRFFNQWSQETSNAVVEGNVAIVQGLRDLKDKMNKGIEGLQGWFKLALMEKFDSVDTYVEDRFESLEKVGAPMVAALENLQEKVGAALHEFVEKDLGAQLSEFQRDVNTQLDEIRDTLAAVQEIDMQEQLQLLEGTTRDLKQEAASPALAKTQAALKELVDAKVGSIGDRLLALKKEQADHIATISVLARVLEGVKEDVQKLKGGA